MRGNLRETLVKALEYVGFDNITVTLREPDADRLDEWDVYLIVLNPAANRFASYYTKVLDPYNPNVRTWYLENAERTYKFTFQWDEFQRHYGYRPHDAWDWAVRVAHEFRNRWLADLSQVKTGMVHDPLIDYTPPSYRKPTMFQRVFDLLAELTRPRVTEIVENPKGIYPSTGEPVK